MKTDMIQVSGSGNQIGKALEMVEKIAAYKELNARQTLQLRLLTEEMMGLMRSITGETEGSFWIEDEQGEYQLHLLVNTIIDMDKRDQLLAVSTSGKNEAARGLMGRIRDFFEQGTSMAPMPFYYSEMPEEYSGSALQWEWKMSTYQSTLRNWVEQDEKAREMWDELEKSVVTHVADDVKVSMRGQRAELTIIKRL